MTESNKSRLIEGAKVLALVLLGFIALITNVEIWNCAHAGNTDGFHVVVSILNFVFEGVAVYGVWRWLFKKSSKNKE